MSSRTPKQQSVAAAYSTGQSSHLPNIQSSATQSRIRHRELISSIIGTTNFNVGAIGTFPLNPGLSGTFPWLSTQALGWEQYHFHKLRLCYYTRTGSTTPGSILLAPDYDAADAAPDTEFVASSYQDCVEDAPWKDIVCILDEKSMHPDGDRKYIRTGVLAANLDIKTYDVGNLFVGTVDGTAVNWGKLWIEYDISFYTPQLPPTGGNQIFQSMKDNGINPPTTANILGTTPNTVVGSGQIYTVAGEVVTFQLAGSFLVNYFVSTNAGTATQTGVPTLSAGSTFTNYLTNNQVTQEGSGGSSMSQIMLVNMLSGGNLTFNNTIATGLHAELAVVIVPPGFA